MQKKKLLLIGNGMAGVNVIEHVVKLNREKYEITIIGKEPHPNYNRILLSAVLTGETRLEDIVLNDWDWYREHQIRLLTGTAVTSIDPHKQVIVTDTGLTESYDELVIATGSLPFMLPIPGADKPGVIAFRDISDCELMMDAAKNHKHAVVIGGGLLGLEAARGLLNLGMEVQVVHLSDTLMERQLDRTAAQLLQAELEKQGMTFLLNKQTAQILGEDRARGVQFADGTVAVADLVVMAVGIRPNVQLAKDSGIDVNRGIVVNDFLETSQPHIYAVGECAEHRGTVYGLVAPLWEQGAVLAKRLCDVPASPYEGSVVATKLKVSGVDVFSAGEFQDGADTQAVVVHDGWKRVYKKVLVREGKIVGGVLFGDTGDSARLFKWVREEADMTDDLHGSLIGGGSACGSSQTGTAGAVALDDADLICGCNGVTKGDILSAIKEKGLSTLDEVKGCTGASRSCGGCKPLVAELLGHVLGEGAAPMGQEEAICGCTTLTRDEVVLAIREKHLTHTREVMNVLGWKHEEGCSKCRPALNYYIGMVWPREHEDERESRFVNERVHANIQNNGTYSVVPRMYGGVTTAHELRQIADVAEKYQVPLIKLTGGQRIDLFGVKKEDLPNVWAELGMPSGYAYGKALRTVKTCVGADFCRFGTQDSIGLGIAMEKQFERLQTPAKVKMAVSACPRNCAESGIKDVGVVGVDGGWEIYVGGNGGVRLRAGDLLCKVKTEAEVREITAAYLQYYRETGHYGERTSEWVQRIGLQKIQQTVVHEQESRLQLAARLEVALQQLVDPWQEVLGNETLRQAFYEEKRVTQ